jgi:Branched-chain amino acid transport system / permease component
VSEFLQQVINGLALGSIYALIAIGYTMVYGVLRFINFAHSDVLMLGAFTAYFIAPTAERIFGPQSIAGAVAVVVVTAPGLPKAEEPTQAQRSHHCDWRLPAHRVHLPTPQSVRSRHQTLPEVISCEGFSLGWVDGEL